MYYKALNSTSYNLLISILKKYRKKDFKIISGLNDISQLKRA